MFFSHNKFLTYPHFNHSLGIHRTSVSTWILTEWSPSLHTSSHRLRTRLRETRTSGSFGPCTGAGRRASERRTPSLWAQEPNTPSFVMGPPLCPRESIPCIFHNDAPTPAQTHTYGHIIPSFRISVYTMFLMPSFSAPPVSSGQCAHIALTRSHCHNENAAKPPEDTVRFTHAGTFKTMGDCRLNLVV